MDIVLIFSNYKMGGAVLGLLGMLASLARIYEQEFKL